MARRRTTRTTTRRQPSPQPLSTLQLLRNKFKRLKEIQAELLAMKAKYQEQDALMAELLPLFIEQEADKFVIHREITLGTKKYRLSPHFYDDKKGVVVSKVWKSSAFPTGTIE